MIRWCVRKIDRDIEARGKREVTASMYYSEGREKSKDIKGKKELQKIRLDTIQY